MNVVPIDPVFSNWLNLNIKVSIINCSTNSKSCKANYFFLRNSSRFFFSFLAFITLFQLFVGFVYFVASSGDILQ